MAELEQPNIVGNYLSSYYAAQQKKQAEQERQFQQERLGQQDQRSEALYKLQMLDGVVKTLGNATDDAGLARAKEQWVAMGLPAEAVAPYGAADIPMLREKAGVQFEELKGQLLRTQIRGQEANIRQSDAAAAASRALAGVRASGGGVEPGASLTPETVDFMADQYIAGDPSVMVNLGRGAQGAKNIIAVREAIARKVRAGGGGAADVAMAIGEFQGFKAGNRTLGGRVANMGMAVNEARQMADLVVAASDAVPRGQIRAVNDALNAYQSQTGDPKIVRFGAALNSFINAYARAISPTGVPTVNDKEHARDMLNTGFTQGQVKEVVDQLKAEMAAASKAPGITKEELRSTFRNEHGGAVSTAPSPKSGWSIKRVP